MSKSWAIATGLGLFFISTMNHVAQAESNGGMSTGSLNTEAELYRLLQERNHHQDRINAIDAQIQARFAQTRAVLVLDMAGFSRTTQDQGIIATLAQIERMRSRTVPVIAAHQGHAFKLDADNIYAVFPDVDAAAAAAIAILDTLNAVDLHASIGIGYGEVLVIEDRDVFGDAVNLASKLGEDIAADDEILLSKAAFRALTRTDQVSPPTQAQISGLDLPVYPIRR